MLNLNRVAENSPQHLSQRGAGVRGRVDFLGRLGDQSGTLGTDCGKDFRMRKGEAQRAIAAHRDSADRSIISGFLNAVLNFDERNEFLKKKISVADPAVSGIDI